MKTLITLPSGVQVEAAAPVIISASRSTDIPAFYAQWFINRLKAGYCVWYNPFNRKPMYVSFKNCKVVVFWTKNPAPIIPLLPELDKRGIHYYFQATLNDYENERFEPNVPPLSSRIATFQQLSSLIGKERVIWRSDPLILTPEITPRVLLTHIYHIGNQLKGCTEKLVFSFIDIRAYRKVQLNLVKETHSFCKESVADAEPTTAQQTELLEGLVKLREHWKQEGWNLTLATCGEEINKEEGLMQKYGIEKNRCIDGELMEHIWGDDRALAYYLHTGKLPEPDLFGSIPPLPATVKNLKDKGQRLACGCMVSKDIGMYDTCNHLCVYCYANTSRAAVQANLSKHSDASESIIE